VCCFLLRFGTGLVVQRQNSYVAIVARIISDIDCYNKRMTEIVLIAHNIRSTHNVGSLLRTSDGFGVSRVVLSGYSPYPAVENDVRLPHIRDKLTRDIHKTALGAESMVDFEYCSDLPAKLMDLKSNGFRIVGLEQTDTSILLPDYDPPKRVALLLGEEVLGIDDELIALCDDIIEIPMRGQKESFNVSVAAGISLYHLCFPA